jgi:hypothetical protein
MAEEHVEKRFAEAVTELTSKVQAGFIDVEDDHTDAETKCWLNSGGLPLDWSGADITCDEWFFITTLYGTMTLDGQRTHIRKFFPVFIQQVARDIRCFTPALVADWGLRQPWMKTRLCRMSDLLRQQRLTMNVYVASLRETESRATPENPMPALARIMRNHRAGEGKTLSVFIRDCVKGNCFPIDSSVAKHLNAFRLPRDERQLVSLCTRQSLNPRRTARIFYQAPN